MSSRSWFSSARQDSEAITASIIIASALFYLLSGAVQVSAATGTSNLYVTVATALTFVVTTGAGDQFGTLTPGTAKFATSTLAVTTNDTNGWLTGLSGDQKDATHHNFELLGASTTQITDQTEWIPGAATTSAGNAVRQGSLANSGNVLAFRVMTASTTNGVPATASSWWGSADNYTDNAATLWAGIASTTNGPRTIGNAGVGSYSATAHINTVLYYVNVAASQPTGQYLAPLTYTATGN
jgi:hypothetical protein